MVVFELLCMNRRSFLVAAVSGSSMCVSGCTDELGGTQSKSGPVSDFVDPVVQVIENSEDIKSGVRTVRIQVELNSADRIRFRTLDTVIRVSGRHSLEVGDYDQVLVYTYPRGEFSGSGQISVPMQSNPDSAQVRFLQFSASNIDVDGVTGSSYSTHRFSWDTYQFQLKIPDPLYRYYKNRYRVPEYGAYGADPFDTEVLQGIVNEFEGLAESTERVVSELIQFVQSMEYTQDKVATGYNEYPKFPVETLVEEGGDCEDTVILLASILFEMGYGVRLILLPNDNHMALGVKGDDSITGSYYTDDGDRYYYVETAGENWDIGEVPSQIQGDAQLKRITGHPTLTSVVSSDGITEGGAPKYKIEIRNTTEYLARDVQAKLAFQTEEGSVSTQGLSFGSIVGSETVVDTVWIEPPPAEKPVRLKVVLYENSHIHDEFASEYIDPSES